MKGGNQMKTAMNRLVPIVLFSLILSSCASLNPLDVLNPNKPSLEVNAQVGKTNEQERITSNWNQVSRRLSRKQRR